MKKVRIIRLIKSIGVGERFIFYLTLLGKR